ELRLGDSNANVIPMSLVKPHEFCRFILGSIRAVDARNPDDAAAPSTHDKSAVGIRDRKRQTAKEIAAIDFHGLQRDFVIRFGNVIGQIDPGESDSLMQEDLALLDIYLGAPGEIGRFPALKGFAIK